MIDLTPLDVRNKRGDFRKAMRGYEPQEVDIFLELVAERLEVLVRENLQLRERTHSLQTQVSAHGDRERAVQDALVTAQELSTGMRTQAQRETEHLIREAEVEARRLLAEADQEVRERLRGIERQTDVGSRAVEDLERRRKRFLTEFRGLLERELDVVQVEEERAPLEDRAIDLDLGPERAVRTTPAVGAPHSELHTDEAIPATVEIDGVSAPADDPSDSRDEFPGVELDHRGVDEAQRGLDEGHRGVDEAQRGLDEARRDLDGDATSADRAYPSLEGPGRAFEDVGQEGQHDSAGKDGAVGEDTDDLIPMGGVSGAIAAGGAGSEHEQALDDLDAFRHTAGLDADRPTPGLDADRLAPDLVEDRLVPGLDIHELAPGPDPIAQGVRSVGEEGGTDLAGMSADLDAPDDAHAHVEPARPTDPQGTVDVGALSPADVVSTMPEPEVFPSEAEAYHKRAYGRLGGSSTDGEVASHSASAAEIEGEPSSLELELMAGASEAAKSTPGPDKFAGIPDLETVLAEAGADDLRPPEDEVAPPAVRPDDPVLLFDPDDGDPYRR